MSLTAKARPVNGRGPVSARVGTCSGSSRPPTGFGGHPRRSANQPFTYTPLPATARAASSRRAPEEVMTEPIEVGFDDVLTVPLALTLVVTVAALRIRWRREGRS